MPEKFLERRHHQRVAFNGPAKLQMHGLEKIVVRTRNISVGGLSLVSSLNILPGTLCTIHVSIPDGTGKPAEAEFQTRVANSTFNSIEDGYLIGLSFVDLSAKLAATIARFMKSR
jgi:hypothetical protein